MSKKVIKSSNKNEKYNLKSVLDTDNIMSGVSLKTVTAIGCASVIASCNKDPEESKNGGDENELKWDDFKACQAKFKKGKEDFDKFVSACKKQGISKDKIKEMIEQLKEQDVQKVLDGKEIKEENGKITIDGKVIDLKEPKPETSATFSNFDNLSEKQKKTLKEYGITDQKTLEDFLNIEDNKGFKSKNISELFDEKGINDDNLKTKLEAYKNSKQQPTPQVSEEKVKKLKKLMQHDDDNYTIYNFIESNVKKTEIDNIYELIKGKANLTDDDKNAEKKDSPAKQLKSIIENTNNIKAVQLTLFNKIVDELKKDKEFFEFSSDKKSLKIKINFKLKDKDNKDQTVSITKEYKPDDIDITKKLDIEDHQIYKYFSSLKEIKKSSINEIFTLPNAKDKNGKDIANGAGDTSDLNAYLVVLKKNFDEAIALNITIDDVKNKIYDQLLKNIQAKLLDFVDQKLKQTEKGSDITVSQIVTAMKSTGICQSVNTVKDEDSMKDAPDNSTFFLKDIIGTGGFLNAKYQAMIAEMFKHFNDKYKADNVGDFKKKINEELKATDFTDNDANTKLKINNGESAYFVKKTAPAPSGWDKFKDVINKINAIGEVSMDDNPNTNKLNNDSKTIADATKIDHINKAFEAIHAVRTELDKITEPILTGSKLYEFLEDIVGKKGDNDEIKYENYGVYNAAAAMPITPLTTTVKHVTGGLLPLAIMTKATNFKTLGNAEMGNILKADCTGEFQASILKYVKLCLPDNIQMTITKTNDDGKNDYKIATVSTKDYQMASKVSAQNWGCTALAKTDGNATSFVKQLLQVQNTIGTDRNKFLDYIRAMKVVEKIEYTAVDQPNNKAIYVGNTDNTKNALSGKANCLNPHAALLTNESDFKQILPFLGKIELVVDILVLNDNINNTADAAGTAEAFAKNGDNSKKINIQGVTAVVPYNINRNRVYKDKDTALNDIKGTPVANTEYSYGILADAK